MYKVKTLNPLSDKGLSQLDKQHYQITESENADAILVRSHKMHDMPLPDDLLVIGRAGAGTNNIPLERCTELGIPVLNTPGANSNAVKELVLTAMLMVSRNIIDALDFTRGLSGDTASMNQEAEKQKKHFVGTELPGKNLAVIGLGYTGVKVANAAADLGMNVCGYDPHISIKNAWNLNALVEQSESIAEAVAQADYISCHVPLLDATKGFMNSEIIKRFKNDATLLNFSRSEVVDAKALLEALNKKPLQRYICDFPHQDMQNHSQVTCLPHLGASTHEAQENCAVMIVKQIKNFLETGQIENSVNFPRVKMPYNGGHRIAITNQNIPNMVAQITQVISEQHLNILDMINQSRDKIAYTLIDLEKSIPEESVKALEAIEGVIKVRVIQ